MLADKTRQDFENTLRSYGHTAYLRRRRDAVASGPFMRVAGGRYERDVEAWTIYRMMRRMRTTSTEGSLHLADDGFVSDNQAVFYCQTDCAPKTADLWIEATPHERHAYETWLIKRVIPYYIASEVVYFACLCERVEPVA